MLDTAPDYPLAWRPDRGLDKAVGSTASECLAMPIDPRNAADPEAECLTDLPGTPLYYRDEQVRFDSALFDQEQQMRAMELLKAILPETERRLRAPPFGLPGVSGDADPDVMALLQLGANYLRAAVAREPRRMWNIYSEARDTLREAAESGLRAIEAESAARARARAEASYTFIEGNLCDRSTVYFIGSTDGPIKIGIALDVSKRLKGLQTSHPSKLAVLATTAGGREQEKAYHCQFADSRMAGEWFERTPELLGEIERLSSL